MNYQYITLANQKNLIEGVTLRKLIFHKDQSGTLMEILRSDWPDVFGKNLPFAMQYLSITPSGIVRDKDQWHVHKNQEDRFICIKGRIVVAIYDPRPSSRTSDQLNLFLMGPQKEEEMYLLVIPRGTYHGFMVVSKEPGYLLNFPTALYTGKDEGRVTNNQFNWQDIRNDFIAF